MLTHRSIANDWPSNDSEHDAVMLCAYTTRCGRYWEIDPVEMDYFVSVSDDDITCKACLRTIIMTPKVGVVLGEITMTDEDLYGLTQEDDSEDLDDPWGDDIEWDIDTDEDEDEDGLFSDDGDDSE